MLRRASMVIIAAPIIAVLFIILIITKAKHMLIEGIKNNKWTPEADAFISKALFKGKSFGWIAAKLGVTRNAAIGRYNRTKRAK